MGRAPNNPNSVWSNKEAETSIIYRDRLTDKQAETERNRDRERDRKESEKKTRRDGRRGDGRCILQPG